MTLIQNTLNGSQKAQEILYNKYKKLVERFLKNKYSLCHDLDDDVSEIMIKVFMNINTFDETKSKFMSWVFSIAKNYMIDKWRSNTTTTVNIDGYNNSISNGNTLFTASTSHFTTTNNFNSLTFASANTSNNTFETNNSINYISAQLSPQDYTLLDMKYIQGYDYNEIGKEFNITSSTVSNRVNYIKTKLKKNNINFDYE